MDRWDWTRVSGPLAPYAVGYDQWLVDQGFAPLSRPARMRQFGELSRWLGSLALSAEQLTPARMERCVAERREAGHVRWVSPLSWRLPLRYLREIDVIPTASPAGTDRPLEWLLEDYRVYLARERGLTPEAIRKYEAVARLFLGDRERIDGLALERLTAADVSEFLARECPRRSVSGARTLVAKLRPLLRYLHVTGLIGPPLRWAVPGVADLRDRSLPRSLAPEVVGRLLGSCDRGRSVGCRDYAILLLLARLGLRGGEVAALRLEDGDWRHGEILVRGKGGRHDRLPLPSDVGEALADYLRHRRRVASRAVFLRAVAPVGPMTSGAVCNVERSLSAVGTAGGGGAPVAAYRRHRDAQGRRLAAGDRAGVAPPSTEDDRDLREGRPSRAEILSVAVAGRWGMSSVREVLGDYLRIRRQLGFGLVRAGAELEDFVGFLERADAERITTGLALKWATQPIDASPYYWRLRLGMVRGFARYLATIDPESEVPPEDLLRSTYTRVAPYVYREREIVALMSAAGALRPALRGASYRTVIGLMASTGIRIGEALGLDRRDVDLRDGALHVRAAKQRKQREVPLHPTTTDALRAYARERDRYASAPETAAFFASHQRRRIDPKAFNKNFKRLIGEVGLEGCGQRARPRPHDLTHTFAVRTVLNWYRDGVDVQRELPRLSTYPTRRAALHILVCRGRAGASPAGRRAPERSVGRPLMTLLAPTLQAFFTDRLMTQRNASPRTIAAYRDTFRLLLSFAQSAAGKPASRLDFGDLDAPMIGAFLSHLEQDRGNSARTRNARLAAVHSLFRYAALRHPEHAASIARVIEIPAKRFERPTISYLDQDEIAALLRAPDCTTWLGRRDHALLLLAVQTGLRVSEIVSITISAVTLGTGANIRVIGKGRKTRCAILTRETAAVRRGWLRERAGSAGDPLFPTRTGTALTTRAVALLLDKHIAVAARECRSLSSKRVTPHVLRHTNAMLLRAQDIDILTIALWLGHESTKSTEIYLDADDRLKQQAIDRTTPIGTAPGRYRPPDPLLAFLEQL